MIRLQRGQNRRLAPLSPVPSHYGGYLPCPDCALFFKVPSSFVSHMVIDHWWDEAAASRYGSEGEHHDPTARLKKAA